MELTKKYINTYIKADKQSKSEILNTYCSLTGISRNTATQRFKRIYKKKNSKLLIKKIKPSRSGRRKKFMAVHKAIIKKAFDLSGHICAERLHPVLSDYIDTLLTNKKIIANEEILQTCKNISLGSLKLCIREFPKAHNQKNKSKENIYQLIPIHPNFGRNTDKAGYVEIDYVEHSGGNGSGQFAITGTYIDICSQWISRVAGLGKSLKSIKEIDIKAKSKFLHTIKNYHTDNCKTILGHLYLQYSDPEEARKHISRSRPYKKNDNAHVEQKNNDKVRKIAGYHRYDTNVEVKLLNELYDVEDLITNFFLPSAKLIRKEYNNYGKVIKKVYDTPQTPYQRLLGSTDVTKEEKVVLRTLRVWLDLVDLREKSDKIRLELAKIRRLRFEEPK